MNFFQQQERAHKKTYLLVFLFALAVLSLLAITDLILLLALFGYRNQDVPMQDLNWQSLLDYKEVFWSSFIVLCGIGGASWYRWRELRGGGQVIARSLGGEQISASSDDFLYRRLYNIVEEIALAAGTPVPPVYVLPDKSINAFAAGYNLNDAVVAVTEGALLKLNREQLQGVVAHEFSHIFNGDMRLNSRIMALLFGITCITLVGNVLMRIGSEASRHRNSKNKNDPGAAIFVVGLMLVIVGGLGTFFGLLIQAAVSRQREFLADASAVQYTRNPSSIADALKVIGQEGSAISSSYSAEAAHLFFANGIEKHWYSMRTWFASHPPLAKRILSIEPQWDGQYLSAERTSRAHYELRRQTEEKNQQAREQRSRLFGQYTQPAGAAGIVLAVLARYNPQAKSAPISHWGTDIDKIDKKDYLTWVERSIPVLKELSPEEYDEFRRYLLQQSQQAEQPVMAWCLYNMVTYYLDGHFKPVERRSLKQLKEASLKPSLAIVLSVLANQGHSTEEERQKAFQIACTTAEFDGLQRMKQVDLKLLDHAITTLRQAQPAVLERLNKAMRESVFYDDELNVEEINLVSVISSLLDIPLTALGAFYHLTRL